MNLNLIKTIIIILAIGGLNGQGDFGETDTSGHEKVAQEYRQELEIAKDYSSRSGSHNLSDLVPADNNDEQITAQEHSLLIKITYLEARGESLEGKTAVVRTILNRVDSKEFPDSIEGVIYQTGQFQPAKYLEEVRVKEEYLEEIEKAILEALESESEELYFVNPVHANQNSYRWMTSNLTFLYREGNHEFYK